MNQTHFLRGARAVLPVVFVAMLVACGTGGGGSDTGDGDDGAPLDVDVADVVGDAVDTVGDTGPEWPEGMTPVYELADPVMAGGLPAGTAFDASDRPVVDLSGAWRFRFDDADAGVANGWFGVGFDRRTWVPAPVPGTWDMDIEGGFDRQTVGWYAREFSWDDDSPFVRLRFEGVFREARVWLNGQELGGDDLPYLPFAFDVTGLLNRDAPNLLVVRVDNRLGRQTLPCGTTTAPGLHGWFPYGGITRPVVVEGSGATSVARLAVRTSPGDVASPAAAATPDNGPWRVHADVVLQRATGSSGTARLSASVTSGGEPLIEWGPADLPADVSRLALDGIAETPELWDPEHPGRTYRLDVVIEGDGAVETVSVDFAFRTVAATGGRLLLNGVDRYLHGMNRHEDLPDKGPVFDAEAMAADVAAMKDLGVDFARPAHYPNDVRTLRALEAAGILLAEEIPVYQLDDVQLADPVLIDRATRALRRMIHRDFNRPAIGLWSIANEVWTFADTAPAFMRTLRTVARELDPDRPVMAAVVSMPGVSFSEVDLGPAEVDVIGINEYFGWYFNETTELGDLLDAAHARFPDKTLFVSEYGADAQRTRHAYGAQGEEPLDDHSYSEEYQAWFHRKHLRQMAEREFIRGVAPWVLADFRMQWTPTTGKPHPVPKTNLKGLMDAWRRPKAAYDVVKAAYGGPDGLSADVGLSVPAEPACGNSVVEPSEACDGGTLPCVELGTSFASGDASCRGDCSGWDVSTCASATPPELAWEVVKPALRDPARWGDARCNDGTPFAFRVRRSPTGSQDWVISLEGGGFCDDNAMPCVRPLEKITTLPEADRAWLVPDDDNGGIFDVDSADNPVWHDANWAFGPYCTSDFWLGTRTAPIWSLGDTENGWYFAGRLNVQALLETLVRHYGLADAAGADGPRVLFSGTSSGGLGTLADVDLAAAMLPDTAAAGRLKVLVDAGWLVHDWDDPDARLVLAQVSDLEVVRVAYDHFQAHMNPLCESARVRAGGHAGDCLMGLYAFPYLVDAAPGGLGLPVLFQQSLADTAFSGFHNHDDDEAFEVLYGESQMDDALAADPGDPLQAWWFLGNSHYHDICRKTDWTLGDPGNTFRDLLERFWVGGEPERIIWNP